VLSEDSLIEFSLVGSGGPRQAQMIRLCPFTQAGNYTRN